MSVSPCARHSGGFSLLEVMVALLVFSLGVLGLGALLLVNLKVNHSAHVRTQVLYQAQAMGERMSANVAAVSSGAYNTSSAKSVSAGGSCDIASPCSATQLATNDIASWFALARNLLPIQDASIACSASAAVPNAFAVTAPYDGLCTLTITWSEVLGDSAAATTQTLAWAFQP